MAFSFLKSLLPDKPVPTRILRGPFRGARIVMNPRESMRKVFGLYEHELNGWLEQALKRVMRVLDVGANDGYFCFGCAAAFRRLGIRGTITAFEPQDKHALTLRESVAAQEGQDIRIEIVQALVGQQEGNGMTTLDALAVATPERRQTLIKIDVEGAEVDVVKGAQTWMDSSNLFVIEVHQEAYLAKLKEMFAARGHELRQVEQRALPLLGREVRDTANWWLVSASVPMA
jgi:hypothetical protein